MPYLPSPDSIFQTDLQYYMKRIDRVQLDTAGNIIVVEGKADATNPIVPVERSNAMTLGYMFIPPYPSLSIIDAKTYNRQDYCITSSMSQNRRYTMKDIGSINKRIDNIEYYTSLSLLEQSAASLLVRSSTTGQNRFQNGIFVENFKGFDRSNVNDPSGKFYISMDTTKGELRPAHPLFRSTLMLDTNRSQSVMQHGDLVMLEHTSTNAYQSQKYASKYRSCIEGNIYHYNGTVALTPTGTDSPDISKGVNVTTPSIDMASNWLQLENAWGTQWGAWQEVRTVDAATLINASTDTKNVTNSDGSKDVTTLTQTIVNSQTTLATTGTYLQNQVTDNTLNLGTFVTGIDIMPYLKSSTIAFKASGMKPNTKLYTYFGNIPVSTMCAPTNRTVVSGEYTYSGVAGSLGDTNGSNSGIFGDQIISDNNGNAQGYFQIAENAFRSEENDFVITDINNLETGADAVTTTARTTFYGSKLAYKTGQALLNTRNTILSYEEVKAGTTINGLGIVAEITKTHVPAPPPPPPARRSCGCGTIICTKLYELGLMDYNTFKADEEFGEILRASDPDVYWGYIKWASIVVGWMSGETPDVLLWIRDKEKRQKVELDWTLRITHRIATPWAEHMQYLVGRRDEDNLAGKLIMAVGKPISRLISKLPKFGKENSGKSAHISMIGLFFVLYGISKMFGGKFGFPEPINI